LRKTKCKNKRNNTKDIKAHKSNNISSKKIIKIEIIMGDNDESSQ
jgi:hypothetical protein